jgi:biotin-(acetyl-CoA carboxylase) ligase
MKGKKRDWRGRGREGKKWKEGEGEGGYLLKLMQNATYVPRVFQVPCVYAFAALLQPLLRDMKNISFPHGFQIT